MEFKVEEANFTVEIDCLRAGTAHVVFPGERVVVKEEKSTKVSLFGRGEVGPVPGGSSHNLAFISI